MRLLLSFLLTFLIAAPAFGAWNFDKHSIPVDEIMSGGPPKDGIPPVDDPQFEALLGYGPSAADPLTGETIAADAYVYGAAIDSYAVWGADVIDLMRGAAELNVPLEVNVAWGSTWAAAKG